MESEDSQSGDAALQTGTSSFHESGKEKIEKKNIALLNIDFGMLDGVYEVLTKKPSNTKDVLLKKYLSRSASIQKVKDFLSNLRQDYNTFLKSSGENKDTGFNNDNSVTDWVYGPSLSSQTTVASENVKASDTVNEVKMEVDAVGDEPIDMSIKIMPVVSSSSRPPNVECTSNWKENITNMLFNNLYLDTRAVLLTQDQKICKMGKRLFTTLFSEQEILGGFARAKKNIPAYDGNRVFEISQIINFMLNQNHHNEHLLQEFRCGQKKNNGLEDNNYKLFWTNVMIKFASDERKRIKNAQS